MFYKIKRDPTTNPIYKTFDFSYNETLVKPGEALKLKITYYPILPKEISIDYLQIQDTLTNKYAVKLKGESKAFSLHLSTARLYFHCTPKFKNIKQTVEMQNKSDMITYYQFENIEETVFQTNKPLGILQANSHEFISFKFKATKPGVYYNNVYCLSLYHVDIIK